MGFIKEWQDKLGVTIVCSQVGRGNRGVLPALLKSQDVLLALTKHDWVWPGHKCMPTAPVSLGVHGGWGRLSTLRQA